MDPHPGKGCERLIFGAVGRTKITISTISSQYDQRSINEHITQFLIIVKMVDLKRLLNERTNIAKIIRPWHLHKVRRGLFPRSLPASDGAFPLVSVVIYSICSILHGYSLASSKEDVHGDGFQISTEATRHSTLAVDTVRACIQRQFGKVAWTRNSSNLLDHPICVVIAHNSKQVR